MSKKSIPNRLLRAGLTQPLLLAVFVLCTGCPGQPESSPSGPIPATSPAFTDSPVSAVEQPAASTPETDAEPTTEPEHSPKSTPDSDEEMAKEVQPELAQPDIGEEEPPAVSMRDKLDFGEPLVEGLGENERLAPKQPVWLTKDRKSVVVQSMVCQRKAPLELFACLVGSKEHESVLAVPVKAFFVHAGLLATGAEQGTPVSWDPEYRPPTGTEIEIDVLWKDEAGKIQRARAQDWVKDAKTGKAMAHPWVFAGSQMYKDEETGKEHYVADGTGELVCVSNFPSATLDVPVESSDSNEYLIFEAFTERIPPLGTPVTMVLTPKLAGDDSPQ